MNNYKYAHQNHDIDCTDFTDLTETSNKNSKHIEAFSALIDFIQSLDAPAFMLSD